MGRKHKEYSLFLRPTKDGKAVYHVKLWDAKAGRYSVSRSTGETAYDGALLKVPGIQLEIAAGVEKREDPVASAASDLLATALLVLIACLIVRVLPLLSTFSALMKMPLLLL